jgi:uncharacterized membrane protein
VQSRNIKLKGKYMKLVIILIAIIAITAQVITPILVGLYYPSLESRALFGDSFGITNSIFSLLAILAILYTIISQHAGEKINTENINKTIKLNALATLLKVTYSKLKYLQSDLYYENQKKNGKPDEENVKTRLIKIDQAKLNRDKFQDELDKIFDNLD